MCFPSLRQLLAKPTARLFQHTFKVKQRVLFSVDVNFLLLTEFGYLLPRPGEIRQLA